MDDRIISGIPATVIEGSNLSHAWGKMLCRALQPGATKLSPLLINLSGFPPETGPDEDAEIRAALDLYKKDKDLWTVDDVAFTIFPQVYWDMAQGDIDEFFLNCLDAAPELRKMQGEKNSGKLQGANYDGIYFERLVNFGADREEYNGTLNQLKTIIENYNSGTHRASMLQATETVN